MRLLTRHWFQVLLVYCLTWAVVCLGILALFGANAAAIANAIGSLGLVFVCGGVVLLDMYVPATRRWLR